MWTPDVERFLNNIRLNCLRLTEYHRERYFRLTGFIKWFRLPVIVLSAANSVLSPMLVKFCNQDVITILTSVISLIVGIIGSIELYFGVQDKITKELSSSKDHYSLATVIFKMLSLKQENRHIEALVFLDDQFTQYSKLISESNIKDEDIMDNLLPVELDSSLQVFVPPDAPQEGVVPVRAFVNSLT